MPLAVGNLLQITDVQTLNNQQVLNVYYYRVSETPTDETDSYAEISADFQTKLMTPIRAIQCARLIHTSLVIRNLTNALDLYEEAFSLAGTQTSAGQSADMPPFVAHLFRLLRSDLSTRNGYKRYAGVRDEDVQGGVTVLASSLYNAIIAGLVDDLVDNDGGVYSPVIVKRPITTPATTYVHSEILDAQYRGVTTQNTRKIGRGI